MKLAEEMQLITQKRHKEINAERCKNVDIQYSELLVHIRINAMEGCCAYNLHADYKWMLYDQTVYAYLKSKLADDGFDLIDSNVRW
jgi:hypothetical protein